mgnify:FL=1
MKQTTMCIISGFFGAVFAVACGSIDGIAKDVILTKSVYEVDCADWEGGKADIGRTVSTNASVTSWYSVDGNDPWFSGTLVVTSEGSIEANCSDNERFKLVIIE